MLRPWYQDFTCVTFIDDSPPLQTWGANNTVVDSSEESDRSSGRVVLGTAAGDLYIFIQRGVRLIPREVRGHAPRTRTVSLTPLFWQRMVLYCANLKLERGALCEP